MHLKSEGKPLNFFNRSQRTIILNGLLDEKVRDVEYIKIDSSDPEHIMRKLHDLNIQSVVVEGGAKLLDSFITINFYDEIRRFKSRSVILSQGIAAPRIDFVPQKTENLLEDELLTYTK